MSVITTHQRRMAQDFVCYRVPAILASVDDQQIGLSEQQPLERQRSIVIDAAFNCEVAQPGAR